MIFAVGISVLLEKRNNSLEESYVAQRTLAAIEIIDEVIADYQLHPFSEEVRPLPNEYEGFTVEPTVNKESISIIPEDWQLEDFELTEEDEKKQRVILRVTVNVSFEGFSDSKVTHNVSVSTLIRLIQIDDEENA